jgi:hypothetical protein
MGTPEAVTRIGILLVSPAPFLQTDVVFSVVCLTGLPLSIRIAPRSELIPV